MQCLIIFTPKLRFEATGMPADFPQLEIEENAQAQVLYEEGGLRQMWALGTKTHGVASFFEAESPEHLQKMVDTFPLVKAEYADCQILPLAHQILPSAP